MYMSYVLDRTPQLNERVAGTLVSYSEVLVSNFREKTGYPRSGFRVFPQSLRGDETVLPQMMT
jgi:hypothetical protein